jgi:pSer/pThr/pTyr-binding forkhead associated (FHA) protein
MRTERLDLAGKPPVLAWLAVLDGPHAGTIFRLNPDATTFGRDGAGCDVVLDDTAASRQHFRIRLKQEDKDRVDYILTDLDSENKTLVNDIEVHQATLSDGDRVKVGRTTLVFKCV